MTTEEFMCLTCGMSARIVLDDDGTSEEEANAAHMSQDGAHYANWLTEDASGNIQSPTDRRTALGIPLGDVW